MSENEHSKCRSLLGSLSDYVDGSLGEELCEEIERHVAECQNCHIVVDTLRKTISLYHESAVEAGDVPGVVRERLFRTLNLDDYIRH
ncbi:MAG: zf-HC2 domain-containing protein [Chloroflexi bacterium]|nr:zf-HC2 domain-containing protein [Chloroflexota bacterium]